MEAVSERGWSRRQVLFFCSGVSGSSVVCDGIDRLLWQKKIMEKFAVMQWIQNEEGFFEKKYICGV